MTFLTNVKFQEPFSEIPQDRRWVSIKTNDMEKI